MVFIFLSGWKKIERIYINPCFTINKVLLEYSCAYSGAIHGFCATMTELSSSDRDNLSMKPRIFTVWPFRGKVADSYSIV